LARPLVRHLSNLSHIVGRQSQTRNSRIFSLIRNCCIAATVTMSTDIVVIALSFAPIMNCLNDKVSKVAFVPFSQVSILFHVLRCTGRCYFTVSKASRAFHSCRQNRMQTGCRFVFYVCAMCDVL